MSGTATGPGCGTSASSKRGVGVSEGDGINGVTGMLNAKCKMQSTYFAFRIVHSALRHPRFMSQLVPPAAGMYDCVT